MILYVESKDAKIKQHREDICRRVGELVLSSSSSSTLFCFIDEHDSLKLKVKIGAANRGIHLDLTKSEDNLTPETVAPHLKGMDAVMPFKNLIYIHASTCHLDVSLIITCAHEMQHFMQHSNKLRLKEVDRLLHELKGPLGFTNWQDHPIEQEAIWVSKATAIKLCGEDSVNDYAQFQMESWRTCPSESQRWKYFRALDIRQTHDLAIATDRIIQPRRLLFETHIKAYHANDPVLSVINFSKPNWWQEDSPQLNNAPLDAV